MGREAVEGDRWSTEQRTLKLSGYYFIINTQTLSLIFLEKCLLLLCNDIIINSCKNTDVIYRLCFIIIT